MEVIFKDQYITSYWKFILLNDKLNWNWMCLHGNPFLTNTNNIDYPLITYYDYQNYFFYENLDINFINKENKVWNYILLSNNKNLTIKYIRDNIDKPWDWYNLSKNSSFNWQNIINNNDLPWDWDGISENENISLEIIKNNFNKSWNYQHISINNMSVGIDRYVSREMKVLCYKILKDAKLPKDMILFICHFF